MIGGTTSFLPDLNIKVFTKLPKPVLMESKEYKSQCTLTIPHHSTECKTSCCSNWRYSKFLRLKFVINWKRCNRCKTDNQVFFEIAISLPAENYSIIYCRRSTCQLVTSMIFPVPLHYQIGRLNMNKNLRERERERERERVGLITSS